MAITVQELIDLAAFDAGYETAGEGLQTAEYADIIVKLNSLLASWDTEYLSIFCVQENTYVLTSNQTTPYEIGPGGFGVFATSTRPISIRAANIITASGTFTFALKILRVEEWAKIIEKGAIGEPPESLYYDNNYPNGLLYLNPWPSAADTLELFTWEQFTQLTGSTASILASTFDYPPGYQEALEWNLSLSIAAMFGRPITQDMLSKATATKASIRANNVPPGPGNAEVIQASGAAVPVPPDAGNAMNK